MQIDTPVERARESRAEHVERRLSELYATFRENVCAATRGWTRHGSLDAAGYEAALVRADDRSARKEIYETYVTRASDRGPLAGHHDNASVIDEILALRHERSRGLGFATSADAALRGRLLASTDDVEHFLIELNHGVRPRAQSELTELWQLARSEGAPKEFRPWDVPYWAERRRQLAFGTLDEAWRAHLAASDVVAGAVGLAARIYGMRFERVEQGPSTGPWSFHVRGADGEAIGALEVSPPAPRLTHREARAVFRRFGEDLQRLLAQRHGTAGFEAELARVPGKLMDRWCYEGAALASFARHAETGAAPPDALVARTRDEDSFLVGLETTARLEVALFDLRVHRDYVPADRASTLRSQVFDTLAQVRREVSVLLPPPWNRMPDQLVEVFGAEGGVSAFEGIVGDVVAEDLFAAFEESGDVEGTGRRLFAMWTQLGVRPATDLYREFRGRGPRSETWLRRKGLAAPPAV